MTLQVTVNMTGSTVEVGLSGELDARTGHLLQAELEKLRTVRPQELVLQVRDLDYLGCAGLRTLLCGKQQMGAGVLVRIVGARQQIRDTLRRAGLHHSFEIAEEEPAHSEPSGTGPETSHGTALPWTAPATLEALGPIGRHVKAAAAAAGLPEPAAHRLRLAVKELATNVATHGTSGAAARPTIELHMDMDAHTLRLTLEDTGKPFDPRQALPPRGSPPPVAQAGEQGGLGIYLALQVVDDFLYERAGDRNRNIFIMRRG